MTILQTSAVLAALLSASILHAEPADKPTAERWIEQARLVAAVSLRDPGSVQFRNLEYRATKTGIVCGELNAKNVFGGYVGFRPFYWFVGDDRATIFDPTQDAPDNILFKAIYPHACAQH